eukprot:scaffold19853_cov56-Phaeocystis_antarctica.AAC.7
MHFSKQALATVEKASPLPPVCVCTLSVAGCVCTSSVAGCVCVSSMADGYVSMAYERVYQPPQNPPVP